jgi:hypothetical protein
MAFKISLIQAQSLIANNTKLQYQIMNLKSDLSNSYLSSSEIDSIESKITSSENTLANGQEILSDIAWM